MSRLNAPGPMGARATSNIYTALAFISFGATFAALVFTVMRFLQLGVL